jgi:hypothetical protein
MVEVMLVLVLGLILDQTLRFSFFPNEMTGRSPALFKKKNSGQVTEINIACTIDMDMDMDMDMDIDLDIDS